MIGVVLAAGQGTRLRPITETRSKAMVPVLGKPLVERVMQTLTAAGINDLVVVAGPGDDELESHLTTGSLAACTRMVIQSERLGTAHALGCAAPLIDRTFVLTACDSLCTPAHVRELVKVHRTSGAAATLTLMQVAAEAVSRSAAVAIDQGRIHRIVEKPAPEQAPSNMVSLPLYVFEPTILEHLAAVTLSERGEYELQPAIQSQIDAGALVRGVVTTWRKQVSTPEDLLRLNLRVLAEQGDRVEGAPEAMGSGSLLVPPVFVGPCVRIGSGCRIGPNVYLEGPCLVGDGVELEDVVVLRHAEVEVGARVMREVVG